MSDTSVSPSVPTLNVQPFALLVNGRMTQFGEKLTRIRDGKQTPYIGVIEENLTLSDLIALAGGEESVRDILASNQNKTEQAITKFVKDGLPDNAEFPLDEYQKAITTGRAVSKTIAEINEEIETLQKEMFKLSSQPDSISKIMEIIAKIGHLQSAKEARSRKKSDETAS